MKNMETAVSFEFITRELITSTNYVDLVSIESFNSVRK